MKTKYDLRPASLEEAGLFYAADSETDLANGCIGHVRMDFGRGEEFWHTWWPRGMEEWNSPEFKQELSEVVDEMRQGVLKNLNSMSTAASSPVAATGEAFTATWQKAIDTGIACVAFRIKETTTPI